MYIFTRIYADQIKNSHGSWHTIHGIIYISVHVNINNLIDLVALSVEGNVDRGNWEFVFMDGSNWEFVFMDGSNGELVDVDGGNGQMGTLGFESLLISGPGQSEFLAFGGDPVRRSLVGVSHNILVSGFAVRVVGDSLEFLLDLRFLAGGVVRLGVAAQVTKREFSTNSTNLNIPKLNFIIEFYLHWLLPSRLRSSDWLVTMMSAYLLSLYDGAE